MPDIISRQEAKATGKTRYFTAEPCKHGHITERRTSNKKCLGCMDIVVRNWKTKNRDKINEKGRQYLRDMRKQTVELLGNKCECCGETEPVFLTIDHRGGGGKEHRRELGIKNGGGTGKFHTWLRNYLKEVGVEEALKRFRILCFNCNLAYHIAGVCPHALAS